MKLIVPLRIPATLLALMMLTTVWFTPALWHSKVYSPASAPHLAAPAQAGNILVCYDEQCFTFRMNPTRQTATNETDSIADEAGAPRIRIDQSQQLRLLQ